MKIKQIAELIVASYFDGSPGSERHIIAVAEEEKQLRKTLGWDGHGNRTIQVLIEEE